MKSYKFKEFIIASLLIIFLMVSLFFPKNTQAQFTDIAHMAVTVGKWVYEKAQWLIEKAWKSGGAIAYRNGLNLFLGQIAKESAEYIATGGKGQKPMFVSDPDYWEKLGDQVLGEYIDQTAKSVTGFTGRSLCDPIDPTIKFNMLVGLDYKYQEMMFKPEIRCSWSQIKERYKGLSKKKLFDFSAELQEGGAARIRAEQAVKIQGEPCFTGAEKEEILSRINALDEGEKFVTERAEKLKKNTEGTEILSENALTQIEKDLEDKASEIKTEMKDMQNTSYMKIAKQCSGYTFKAKFCEDTKCLSMTAYGPSSDECTADFDKYRKCVNDFITEINRVADAGNKLIGQIESVLNVFPDLKPSPPPTLEDINREYNPEASDLAVAFEVQSDLFAKQAEAVEKSKFMQSLSGDINRLTSKISNLTLTPASGIRSQWETSIKEGTAGLKEYTGVPVADAIGVFTNTLVNKLIQQLFTRGLNPSVSPEIVERTEPFLSGEDVNSPTQEESEVLYADLAVASVKKGGEVTIYDEFAVCPDDKKYALPTNCLLNTKLTRAIEEHLTIEEAMEEGLLESTQLVGTPGDYTGLLSWPNVKKLRRYRIFPLGLEIAADKIFNKKEGIGNIEVSLGQLVSDFDKLDSKFYHLVDPNWVLKASTYKCDIKSYSAIPLPGSAQRQETCVNLQDCIHEGEDGQCDTWAYCTREKNIWRFNGDACDSQYASCQTYKRTEDKKQFYYLTNTLDFANCNQNNAGCSWYCSYWDKNLLEGKGNWACTKPEAPKAVFFNNKIEKCSAQSQGCHEYIRTVPGLGTNMIFNGSFELDTNKDNFPDTWRVDSQPTELVDDNNAVNGDKIVKITHKDGTNCSIDKYLGEFEEGQTLTASVWFKKGEDVTKEIKGMLFLGDAAGDDPYDNDETVQMVATEDWQQMKLTHTMTHNDVMYVYIYGFRDGGMDGDYVLYDGLKVETGEVASSYQDYGEINKIYLKSGLECQTREVGCELYTPVNGDMAISGIVGKKDKCGFDCLGYETFQQMPSNFDPLTQAVNLIPSTAKTCAVPGCEEFTNLDTERVEYYSYLRQCVKVNAQGQAIMDNDGTSIDPPNQNLCKKYYTWVGSETTGYQLKKYELKKADQQYEGDPDANGPMNFNSNPNLDWGDCENSTDALVNPHCKQFYDAEGKIYYRLYKNTITCAEDCLSYRRSVDQSIKTAVVSESDTCSKKDDRCREYKGSSGDNVRKVFSEDFEGEQINSRWSSGGEVVAESVSYPGSSLKVNETISLSVDDLVWKNKSYFISFWFKGRADVTVKFSSLAVQTEEGLNPNEWQEIKFSPFYFDKEPTELEQLEISVSSGNFFIDNVVIKEIQDNLSLIKDSWQTPCSCDTLTNHNSYLTGAKGCTIKNTAADSMVGCQVYQGRDSQSYYLKSFTRLCSESAVGCEALIDTQNYDWPLEKIFNSGDAPEDDVVVPGDKMVYLVNDARNKCESKYKGCQKFGQPTLDIDGNVISYADVYLINNPDLYAKSPILCLKKDVGCEEYQGPFYFKNPGEKICEYKENVPVGTNEFKTGWFKTGTNHSCYSNSDNSPYQPDEVTYGIRFNNDPEYKGWAGSCPTDQSSCTEFIDPLVQNLVVNGGFEQDLNGWPANYLPDPSNANYEIDNNTSHSGGKAIKLWSNTDSSAVQVFSADIAVKPNVPYSLSAWVKGQDVKDIVGGQNKHPWVGIHVYDVKGTTIAEWEAITNAPYGSFDWQKIQTLNYIMPASADHITLMITYEWETAGTVWFDNIKLIELNSHKASYYYLNNNKLDKSSCKGMVGLKDGCILFNDASQPSSSLIYDSTAIYTESSNNNDLLVPAVTMQTEGAGDANVILKVKRDRVCGEWLDCTGSREVWDSSLGERREICEFIGRCDKLIGRGENRICGNWVSFSNPTPLTESVYASRDVSWAGMDYSGHSILNMYPIETLFATETPIASGIYKLTFKKEGVDGKGTTIDKTCQIFPEKDSPFPRTKGDEKAPQNEYYNDVNVCSDDVEGNYPDCQCAYKKAEYSGTTRYYNYDSSAPANISIGDSTVAKTKETTVIGLRGFCLEKDESKPADINACLTWWPGPGIGDPDIYENYPEAGYQAAGDKQWYCYGGIFGSSSTAFNNITNTADECWERWTCNRPSFEIPIWPSSLKIHKDEILFITIKIGANDGGKDCNGRHTGWSRRIVYLQENYEADYKEGNWYGCVEDDGEYADNCHTDYQAPDPLTNRCEIGAACTKVQARFDDSGYLSAIRFRACDKSGGGGSFDFNYDDTVKVYLKNGCQYMVKIPDPVSGVVTGAYTDRLKNVNSDWYKTKGGEKECKPYGAYSETAIENNRLVLVGTDDAACDKKPFLHTNEESLKSLFAKIDEKNIFNHTGNVNTGTCNSTKGYCKTTTDRLCYDEYDCPFKDFGKCEGSVCEEERTISCSGDEDCYSKDPCVGATFGTCSNGKAGQCLRNNDCTFITSGMIYGPAVPPAWDEQWRGSALPPTIASVNVNKCDENNVCERLNDGKITISANDTGNIERSQSFPAVLKFFAWADKDHMPIRKVRIDWVGDETYPPAIRDNSVVAKNHKSKGGCDNSDFGSSEAACVEKYFQFTYIYSCIKDGAGWNKYGCSNACCFKPKVTVTDNWDKDKSVSYDGIIIVKP